MEVERISSGVSKLDEFINGGLPKGLDIVLHGEPGSGKTTFAIQFIHEGLRNNENCIFVEMDMLPRDLRTKMLQLGLDSEKYEKKGKLVIVDGVSSKRLGAKSNEKFLIKDPRDLNSIAKSISDARQSLGEGGRLVIDSWASIALNFAPEYRGLLRFTEAFIVESRNSDYETILITDFSIEEKLMRILRHTTSGFIEFITKFDGNNKRRQILIHNLQFTPHSETPIAYTLGNGGIKITEARL